MPTAVDCGESALKKSICIIEAILKNVEETYHFVGGGGISSIKQDSTKTFTVSISQEERVDLITYTIEMSPENIVTIKNRKAGTKNRRH